MLLQGRDKEPRHPRKFWTGTTARTYKLRRHGPTNITQRWIVLDNPLRNQVIELWEATISLAPNPTGATPQPTARRYLLSPARSR